MDAIDESANLGSILDSFEELMARSHRLHLLFTSRHAPRIDMRTWSFSGQEIQLPDPASSRDIGTYVTSRLHRDQSLQQWSDDIKEEISHELIRQGGGM